MRYSAEQRNIRKTRTNLCGKFKNFLNMEMVIFASRSTKLEASLYYLKILYNHQYIPIFGASLGKFCRKRKVLVVLIELFMEQFIGKYAGKHLRQADLSQIYEIVSKGVQGVLQSSKEDDMLMCGEKIVLRTVKSRDTTANSTSE